MTPNIEKLFALAMQEKCHITPHYSESNEYCLWDEHDNYPADTSVETMNATAKKLTILANHGRELIEALEAAIAYDGALESCGNDPSQMSSFCTAQGDTLDSLYHKWSTLSRRVLAQLEHEAKP